MGIDNKYTEERKDLIIKMYNDSNFYYTLSDNHKNILNTHVKVVYRNNFGSYEYDDKTKDELSHIRQRYIRYLRIKSDFDKNRGW